MNFPLSPRATVASIGASRIREVANAGIGRDDVLPFWFGEPDEVTPAPIRAAAVAALEAGDTFYTSNLGLSALRERLAQYLSGLHPGVGADRLAVTSSGVSALMIAQQTLIEPGARVVVVTPVWPNLTEAPRILSADVVRVPLACRAGRWSLDLERLLEALTPATKVLILNSPNNPTGWVITRSEQRVVLEHCRARGIWIIADDVYERLVYSGERAAASFLDIADPDDRIVSTNSFSKSWLMTGWRLGWIVSPRGRDGSTLIEALGKLIEYNTSCAPGFVQRAGLAALELGEPIIAHTVARYTASRAALVAALERIPGVRVAPPDGAMYVFFQIEGASDTLALCKRLVLEAGLGLAPGSAFGPEGEGYVRWCLASSVPRIEEGVGRLARFLAQHPLRGTPALAAG